MGPPTVEGPADCPGPVGIPLEEGGEEVGNAGELLQADTTSDMFEDIYDTFETHSRILILTLALEFLKTGESLQDPSDSPRVLAAAHLKVCDVGPQPSKVQWNHTGLGPNLLLCMQVIIP